MTLIPTQKINNDGEYIFTVSELNTAVAGLLDRHFGNILIQGEITGLKKYASGHMYFSLKDPRSYIRCVLFRGKQLGVTFIPQDGDHVMVHAKLSIYTERGDFQLIVNKMDRAGTGDLQQQFLIMKNKLEQAGLFDPAVKHSIPEFPKYLGIITSPDGAALHDVLTVLKRRFPSLPIRVYASQVQGDAAPRQLIRAIEFANQENICDILLLTRGGGSLEDLCAFNDEALAQAIYASHIPIVSAVGHEIDSSIADFVADQRAPTPSAGAELISPNKTDLLIHLSHLIHRLQKHIHNRLQYHVLEVQQLKSRLKHPSEKLQLKSQHIDTLMMRLEKIIHNQLFGHQARIRHLNLKLVQYSPQHSIAQTQAQFSQLIFQLQKHHYEFLEIRKRQLSTLAAKLNTISPLATLNRGYGIAQNQKKQIISSINQVDINEKILLQLNDGKLNCTVFKKQN